MNTLQRIDRKVFHSFYELKAFIVACGKSFYNVLFYNLFVYGIVTWKCCREQKVMMYLTEEFSSEIL